MTPPSFTGHKGSVQELDEYENGHMLWPLDALHLNHYDYQWEILEQCVRQLSLPPSSNHQLWEYLLEEWRSSLQDSSRDWKNHAMPKHIKAPVVACGGQAPY